MTSELIDFMDFFRHTQCGPKVLELIFLKIEDTYLFFFLIQNKLHWHIYRLLCGCTVSEKLPKIPLLDLR